MNEDHHAGEQTPHPGPTPEPASELTDRPVAQAAQPAGPLPHDPDPAPGHAADDEAPPAAGPDEAPAVDQRRPAAGVTALVGLLAAASLAAAAGCGYVLGQTSYATPPGTVTVVDGARDATGFAQEVHRNAADAVVRISQTGGGVGSGFFYAPGKIVTNAHVVTGSPEATTALAEGREVLVDVTLHDGRTREAAITALDTRLDLAILTLDPIQDVPVLAFADDTPDPGAPLVVLGHPFGEGLMATTGILSGVSNNSRFAESDVQSLMLQIDAAVNPGNSGGPVLDASGAVLGVVTLRPDEADGRAVAGLSLAIPAPLVASALDQLDREGRVAYPLLGVLLRDTTTDDAVDDAAAVTEVVEGSGAQAAGITVGDVIVAVDDTPVTSASDVVEALVGLRPGERVPVEVIDTDGTRRTTRVVLGARTS